MVKLTTGREREGENEEERWMESRLEEETRQFGDWLDVGYKEK